MTHEARKVFELPPVAIHLVDRPLESNRLENMHAACSGEARACVVAALVSPDGRPAAGDTAVHQRSRGQRQPESRPPPACRRCHEKRSSGERKETSCSLVSDLHGEVRIVRMISAHGSPESWSMRRTSNDEGEFPELPRIFLMPKRLGLERH